MSPLAWHAAWIAATVPAALGVLWLAHPGEPPWRAAGAVLRAMFASRRGRLGAALALGTVLADLGLTAIDPWFTAHCAPRDFTDCIAAVEGGAVAAIQGWVPDLLAGPSLAIYVVGYVAGLVGVAAAAARRGAPHAGAFLAMVPLTYLAALPFYVFVPVAEVGDRPGSGAALLPARGFPALYDAYRDLSGADNCFPSLHTSLVVTAAALAWPVGGATRRVALAFALLIPASTIHLGIHWLADIAAGVPFGLAMAALARRVARTGGVPDHHRTP